MSKPGNSFSISALRLAATLSLLPVLSHSAPAQDRSQWLTPVADIQFQENKVMYCYQVSDPVYGLEPLFITSAFTAIPSMRSGSSVADDISKTRKWLNDEVRALHAGNDITSKETFLKACALYIIWNMRGAQLPDEALLKCIASLESDQDAGIAHNAALVRQLYASVCKGIKERK